MECRAQSETQIGEGGGRRRRWEVGGNDYALHRCQRSVAPRLRLVPGGGGNRGWGRGTQGGLQLLNGWPDEGGGATGCILAEGFRRGQIWGPRSRATLVPVATAFVGAAPVATLRYALGVCGSWEGCVHVCGVGRLARRRARRHRNRHGHGRRHRRCDRHCRRPCATASTCVPLGGARRILPASPTRSRHGPVC